jgi:hypothetical protein
MASLLLALFPFWCLDDKGGEESYLSLLFFILVCGRWLYYEQENLLCVSCNTLMVVNLITLIMLSIYVWMIIMPIYLSSMK